MVNTNQICGKYAIGYMNIQINIIEHHIIKHQNAFLNNHDIHAISDIS